MFVRIKKETTGDRNCMAVVGGRKGGVEIAVGEEHLATGGSVRAGISQSSRLI